MAYGIPFLILFLFLLLLVLVLVLVTYLSNTCSRKIFTMLINK